MRNTRCLLGGCLLGVLAAHCGGSTHVPAPEGDAGASGNAGASAEAGSAGAAGQSVEGGSAGLGGAPSLGGAAGPSSAGEAGASGSSGQECVPNSAQCADGNHTQACSRTGVWQSIIACPDSAPVCNAGACSTPSCSGLPATCGPDGKASCCAASLLPSGTFKRVNNANYPGTVSAFRLDTYEITVGRFRNFVAAYTQSMIPSGAGKNPNNSEDPGWSTTFNASLPANASVLVAALQCGAQQTWTAGNDALPQNCIDWYEAEAFCIWDGARLPTDAELNYAAAGGSEQRLYPWGSSAPDCTFANFQGGSSGTAFCVSPGVGAANPVGSESPKGDGKWGQADLAGNLVEWAQDWYVDFSQASPGPCVDCAQLAQSSQREFRGGAFSNQAAQLASTARSGSFPTTRDVGFGARCARLE